MVRLAGLLLSAWVLLSPLAFSQQSEEVPTLIGYVTRVASNTDFDVNQVWVVRDGRTEVEVVREIQGSPVVDNTPLFWGERVMVYGSFRDKKRTIKAHKIVEIKPITKEVSGFGLIDRVLSAKGDPARGGEWMIRADGYSMLIDKQTQSTLNPPLAALSDVGANVWVQYKGAPRSDGIVVAGKAVFFRNEVDAKEEKLRAKEEYDPEKVDANSKQSAVSKATLGVQIEKIPPYHDAVMEARVNRIGQSLIPAYQRALAASDPRKLNFRFSLIEANPYGDAINLPNGIILVPKEIVERLTDDSQLATILASNIASALEKQAYREGSKLEKALAAEWIGGGAALALSLGPGVAVWATAHHVEHSTLLRLEEQSDRVGLSLMHDAGYDLSQAPAAWWKLSSKHPDELWLTEPPERSGYLYEVIAKYWTPASEGRQAELPAKVEAGQSN
jgi:hypothetical protein